MGSAVEGTPERVGQVVSREKRGTGGGEGWDDGTAGWRETGMIWRRERSGGGEGGRGGEGAGGEGAELDEGGWRER